MEDQGLTELASKAGLNWQLKIPEQEQRAIPKALQVDFSQKLGRSSVGWPRPDTQEQKPSATFQDMYVEILVGFLNTWTTYKDPDASRSILQ